MGFFSKQDPNAEPQWPTTMRSCRADGRIRSTDGSVWLYRAVPMAPVIDARSQAEGLAVGQPINAIIEELASGTRLVGNRRSLVKSSYRSIHILLVNVPSAYRPPYGSQLSTYLAAAFPAERVDRRLLLIGVRLQDKVGGQAGGLRNVVDSVIETISTGSVPMADFDKDFADVDAMMSRAGLIGITPEEYQLANSWWSHGDGPDTPMLVHTDHLHVFSSPDSARAAASLIEGHGPDADCVKWTQMSEDGRGRVLDDQHTISFGAVQLFDLFGVDESARLAQWASAMIDEGSIRVSIRGLVEPSKITRSELRRNKKKYLDDIRERESQNKMTREEQETTLDLLSELEANYAVGGPATVMDCSVIVARTGRDRRIGYSMEEVAADWGLKVTNMVARQNLAMGETWIASSIRANPFLHDLPAHTIASSGLPSLNSVGDRTGALLGFTERDRQPAYMDQTAAADEDSVPIFVGVAQSGGGKTVTMLYLADQFARTRNAQGEQTPVIIIDPKLGSDHSNAVMSSGGTVRSLDELVASDGVFDPLRFAVRKESGIEIASSMLMSINPWGSDASDFEVPLLKALGYGIENGADCTGRALQIAFDNGMASRELVQPVFDTAEYSSMFRACVGFEQGGHSLRTAGGITLIKVGDAHLDLPDPNATNPSLQQRIALSLVRMMVFGSAMALAGRSGVLMVDEAWVVLSAGKDEVQRLGRLARSQQVFPMLWTQKISDALEANLAGFISRGLILPIQDEEEALAACRLFKLDPDEARMSRITARGTLSGSTDQEAGAPNWNSMRALRDRSTGRVLRGAVGIYVDLTGRAIPVEVKIPQSFLDQASTNPEDIRRREALAAAEAARQAASIMDGSEDEPDIDQFFS